MVSARFVILYWEDVDANVETYNFKYKPVGRWLHFGISIESNTESLGAESVESGLGLSLSDEFSEHFRSEGFLIMYDVLILYITTPSSFVRILICFPN